MDAVPDFHRPTERHRLKQLLKQGVSVLMLAPRRIGKTWLTHRLEDDLTADGWTVIFLDLEGMGSIEEFLRELCKKIESKGSLATAIAGNFAQRLRQLMSADWDGTPLKAVGSIDYKQFLEALIAALSAQDRDTAILLDEIALFVAAQHEKDPRATLEFLYHLRKLRQSHPRVRWLFTGSIGLDVVARRAALQGAIVDMRIFSLEPFSSDEAKAYVADLCTSGQVQRPFALADQEFEHLSLQIGWLSPFYLMLVADNVRPTGEISASGLPHASASDIDVALEALLDPAYRGYFSVWEEHVRKNFSEQEGALLRAILDRVCMNADGELEATLSAAVGHPDPSNLRAVKESLNALRSVGFLVSSADGRWSFRSGLLRRYWERHEKL